MKTRAALSFVFGLAALFGAQAVAAPAKDNWWAPGMGVPLPESIRYDNDAGRSGILNTSGQITTKGHPFFEPIGSNGRACVTCHQPADAMSISLKTIQERWRLTKGRDPLFATTDGANCPNALRDEKDSHSLLLTRGVFRIGMPWPPKRLDGSRIEPEFDIEVVSDPTGCNTDPVYGLMSANPTVSVFRRPRPVANLKYVVGPDHGIGGPALFNPKGLAMPLVTDPDTGIRVTMQIMSDARLPTLKLQMADAARIHLQRNEPLTSDQVSKLLAFENQVFTAQAYDKRGGELEGGPKALGPKNLAASPNGILGDNFDSPVFHDFAAWKKAEPKAPAAQNDFRQSVARGYDVFFLRPFWVKDSMFINNIGLGNPIKRTCATCHNMQMTGMDLASGWVDLGTTNLPWAKQAMANPWSEEKPDLPLFKVTCREDVPPHQFLGREIYTTDPGRALATGRCMDVGAIVMQQFRGLSARAPYFVNGSAANLRELVDFYDRRFMIGYTEQEKSDLINFLSVL